MDEGQYLRSRDFIGKIQISLKMKTLKLGQPLCISFKVNKVLGFLPLIKISCSDFFPNHIQIEWDYW